MAGIRGQGAEGREVIEPEALAGVAADDIGLIAP